MRILNWLKKNKKYVILVVSIILVVSWISFREVIIVQHNKKINDLEFDNSKLFLEKSNLNILLKLKQREYDSIKSSNDSIKLVLVNKQKELEKLIVKHKKEVDSLMNIPPDTVYKRLVELYPNFDNSPLKYPFSSSQIVPIYKISVSYPLLQQEYTLQGRVLEDCKNLNLGYEEGISNLNEQIGNLQSQVGKADKQISNYQKEIKIINKKVKTKSFWNKTLLITTGITTGIAILK